MKKDFTDAGYEQQQSNHTSIHILSVCCGDTSSSYWSIPLLFLLLLLFFFLNCERKIMAILFNFNQIFRMTFFFFHGHYNFVAIPKAIVLVLIKYVSFSLLKVLSGSNAIHIHFGKKTLYGWRAPTLNTMHIVALCTHLLKVLCWMTIHDLSRTCWHDYICSVYS